MVTKYHWCNFVALFANFFIGQKLHNAQLQCGYFQDSNKRACPLIFYRFFPTLCFLYLLNERIKKIHSAIISIKKKYSLRFQEKLTEIGAILKDPGGKVHSFLKQCLHDICLTQKRGTFTKPFNLTTTFFCQTKIVQRLF